MTAAEQPPQPAPAKALAAAAEAHIEQINADFMRIIVEPIASISTAVRALIRHTYLQGRADAFAEMGLTADGGRAPATALAAQPRVRR